MTTQTPEQERALSMRHTVASFGALWTIQGTLNLPSIAANPTVTTLADRFKGKPCVIVAPGPSLAKNIDLLPALKGRAVMCTYSRTLHKLAQHGVVPDTVTCLDPLDLLYHFEGYPTDQLEALVLGMTSNPKHYALPHKRIFTFSGNNAIEQWIWGSMPDGEKAWLETSCSVATTTTSLAMLMGCDPIIYVGQDMALTGGKYWCEGTSDGDAHMVDPAALDADEVTKQAVTKRVLELLKQFGVEVAGAALDHLDAEDTFRADGCQIEGLGQHARAVESTGQAVLSRVGRVAKVPGYHGGEVGTTPSFSWVREWLGKRAEANPGRFINCTEGGAYLDGMEHMTLAEAIAEHIPDESIDIPGIMDAARESADIDDQRKRLLGVAETTRTTLRNADKTARKLLAALDAKPATPRQLLRLAKLERWLTRTMEPARAYHSMMQQAQLFQIDDAAKAAETIEAALDCTRGVAQTVQRAWEWADAPLGYAAERMRADGDP
jgi:hypothetical protein